MGSARSLIRAIASPIPAKARHDAYMVSRAAAASRFLRHIPAVPPEEVFPGIGDLEVCVQHRFEHRGLPHGDAFVLSLISAWTKPRRIFEIGTGTGRGTVLMLRQAPEARVDTLDLGDQDSASLGSEEGDLPITATQMGAAFAGTEFETRITQHVGDSARFDYSPFLGQMDLVFVDGAHTLEYADSDSRNALKLARPGGTIVWDDCHLYHQGVPQALLQLRREGHQVARMGSSRLAAMRVPEEPTGGN